MCHYVVLHTISVSLRGAEPSKMVPAKRAHIREAEVVDYFAGTTRIYIDYIIDFPSSVDILIPVIFSEEKNFMITLHCYMVLKGWLFLSLPR